MSFLTYLYTIWNDLKKKQHISTAVQLKMDTPNNRTTWRYHFALFILPNASRLRFKGLQAPK
jgi:hypothetical protein